MAACMLLLLAGAANFASASIPPTNISTIQWFACDQNATAPIECGNLQAPLDYSNASCKAILELNLVRVNATKTPKKGSILFNPGGPGSSGRDLVATEAPGLLL